MAARCGDEIVKAPGELTMTCYVTCPDITKTITPDLKCPATGSKLLYIDLGNGKTRLGGSALAQVYNQIGNDCPDIEDLKMLKNAFIVTQQLIDERVILAGHDRSDGGLVVTLLEMAFAGNCSIDVTIPDENHVGEIAILYSEEAGLVLEVEGASVAKVIGMYKNVGVPCIEIGSVSLGNSVSNT
jgi:phosphoribosylformylglycinamidine synthase